MLVKERREVIEVLEAQIKFIANDMHSTIFLCHMSFQLTIKDEDGIDTTCRWNDVKIPRTLKYLKTQKPSAKMNRKFYNSPYYTKDSSKNDSWWSFFSSRVPTISEDVHKEKIKFLNHLIKKLSK